MLTEFGTIEHAVSAMRAGATHYLAKPFQTEQLQLTVEQALAVARLRDENRALLRELQGRRSESHRVNRRTYRSCRRHMAERVRPMPSGWS